MLRYITLAGCPTHHIDHGDREEFFGMYEENAYLRRMLKLNGHGHNELIEIGGYGHEITEVGIPLLLKELIANV